MAGSTCTSLGRCALSDGDDDDGRAVQEWKPFITVTWGYVLELGRRAASVR